MKVGKITASALVLLMLLPVFAACSESEGNTDTQRADPRSLPNLPRHGKEPEIGLNISPFREFRMKIFP